MTPYIPNTDTERQAMLESIGCGSLDALMGAVPETVRLQRPLDLPCGMAEMDVAAHMRGLAARNVSATDSVCFLGAGAYDHYIPAVVGHLIGRQEFYTAYTPYQPEISQGTLQAIFEYQTMICMLTGMDVANASMYDGASALAEAAIMACGATRRSEVVALGSIHPQSRNVLETYARFRGINVISCGGNGAVDRNDLKSKVSRSTAVVIVQSPNFFGIIEEIEQISAVAHESGALLIVSCDPISLGLLKPPGALGADIVVGEGQALGNPMSFGGPYLGFFAATEKLLRKMPGRIAGQTVDAQGRRGFVLTIQAREQHIRREKATSNICSNQALCALVATIYLTAMGKEGLRDVASQCAMKAHYAYDTLLATGRFNPVFDAPFFKEFAVRFDGDVSALNAALLDAGIIGGYDLGRYNNEWDGAWLVAVTEKRTKKQIDALAEKAAAI